MRQTFPLFVAIILLGGCATLNKKPDAHETVEQNEPPAPKVIEPFEAILAAARKPSGIHGVFEMTVRSAARQSDWLFLYSEADPKDQRSLAIAIPKPVADSLTKVLGGDPAERLKGETIRIGGTAKRETVWLYSNGVRTSSYYYQTQLMLMDASRLALIGDPTPEAGPEQADEAESHDEMPALSRKGADTRGIAYVDYVPTPEQIKAQLEADGWQNVRIVRTFPDYLQGPIRALSLFDLHEGAARAGAAQGQPQEYGRILLDHIEYLNMTFGTDGIVVADLVFPDGRLATTFHVAVKQHYVMIIWDPARRDGYVWRSFIYGPDGTPTEMRFLMQRQDLERI